MAGDKGESEYRSYEIAHEELSPCLRPDSDVRDERRQYDKAGLKKNCREDYPEHHSWLLHGCVNQADYGEAISKAERKMDQRKSCCSEEMNCLKWLTPREVESREPQPRHHADDYSEAGAFPQGAVRLRRRTTSRGRCWNYMNACHGT